MLIDLYLQGRLDLDAFVSETIAIDDVEDAFEQDARRRGAPLGGGALVSRPTADRPRSGHLGHVLPGRRDVGRGQQRLADRRRRRGAWSSTPPTTPRPIIEAGRATGGCRAIVCTHAHDDHVNAAPRRLAEATGAPVLLHPADQHALGAWSTRTAARRRAARRRSASTVAGTTLRGAAHPGSLPGRGLLPRAGAGRGVHRRHAVPGGPGATGRSYSDFPHHHRVDPHRLLTLPGGRRSCTPATGTTRRIGAEAPHLQEWIDRGH